jgi:hypothetical protein
MGLILTISAVILAGIVMGIIAVIVLDRVIGGDSE